MTPEEEKERLERWKLRLEVAIKAATLVGMVLGALAWFLRLLGVT